MLPTVAFRQKRRVSTMTATSFPYQQLFILALCRLCEPIAFMSIFPYIVFMVQNFGIKKNDGKIGTYVGLMIAAFPFAEFSTGVLWGRLSDTVGRKPVLIAGLFGTLLSMLVFGSACSLWVALLGRALGGALNGNIGVLNTTVAEIVTDRKHQPRAYSIMPFVWAFGAILGPCIGGYLAMPSRSFPHLFPQGTLFDRFPFLLPNVVCVMILLLGIAVGILFLEETHPEKRFRRDIGHEFGQRLLRCFRRDGQSDSWDKSIDANFEESRPLLDDEPPPGYRTTEGSPRFPSSRSLSPAAPPYDRSESRLNLPRKDPSLGVQKAFTRPVVVNIIGYGILAYHTMSFDQLMPIFLSSESSSVPPHLPFRFMGGFGMSPKDQGMLMIGQGICCMVAQVLLFPLLAKKFGYLSIYRFTVMTWPLLYLIVPYTVLLPQQYRLLGICFCLLWRTTAQALSYPPMNVMIANSAPSTLVLGTINGVAGSTASLSRAFGPTITGLIYSKGLSIGVSGLAWWITGLVCVLGAVESLLMEESRVNNVITDPVDVEAGDDHTMINPLSIDAAIVAAARQERSSADGYPDATKDTAGPLS